MLLFSLEEGAFLVRLARSAATKFITESSKIVSSTVPSKRMNEKTGVFVTIEKISQGDRALRGCIGYPLPYMPLVEATIDSAISAAVNDPRFEPLKPEELSEVVFEVSILTPPHLLRPKEPRDYPSLIKVGRDGLVIERGYYKGLLLPQVPVEYGWDAEIFLSECCMKAGLPPDSWFSREVKVYTFSAEVFTEVQPEGEVVPKKLQ